MNVLKSFQLVIRVGLGSGPDSCSSGCISLSLPFLDLQTVCSALWLLLYTPAAFCFTSFFNILPVLLCTQLSLTFDTITVYKYASFLESYLLYIITLQARRNHQNRRTLTPRLQKPSTAMGALTRWTPRHRLASAATAPRCQALTTQSSLRSSNSRKKSLSKASTCTVTRLTF